jgi:hypothetical protein
MLHRILILVAVAMVVLSLFLVFGPHQPTGGLPHPLAAAGCAAPPENAALPPEQTWDAR